MKVLQLLMVRLFTNNSKLTTIYLPSTLTSVGAEAFWRLGPNKDRTTTVYFAGTRQQLENLNPSAWFRCNCVKCNTNKVECWWWKKS